ncbi:hypothetical protein [Corynebacterium accolens]|nr:hypothetical protein [Corynebacterium accolens]
MTDIKKFQLVVVAQEPWVRFGLELLCRRTQVQEEVHAEKS